MPLTTTKRAGKFRVVEADTGKIAKNEKGTAIDGGGFGTEAKAKAQATAVNISQARKRGKKIPRR